MKKRYRYVPRLICIGSITIFIILDLIDFFTPSVDGEHEHYQMEGLMESPSVDDDGDCFAPLLLNATSVNIEVYYNKAVNYTLMVTFVSFSYDQYPLS